MAVAGAAARREAPRPEGEPASPGAARGALGPAASSASSSALVGRVLAAVVAQAEEPDQPNDEKAHVKHAEADHEDPALGAHMAMLPRRSAGEKS